jgi:hypothetical protein
MVRLIPIPHQGSTNSRFLKKALFPGRSHHVKTGALVAPRQRERGHLYRPMLIFGAALVALWLSAQAGAYLRRRRGAPDEDEQQDLGVLVAASLTLLGLIIGFSFSMAVTRYEKRKNYEEDEANAIGTEYFRVTMLPASQARRAQDLLAAYLNQRILFYTTSGSLALARINAETARLQGELWSTVQAAVQPQPTPTMALVVSGLNEVFNSQGYTQAAWWNRIPMGAWSLTAAIAISCNFLFGYAAHHTERKYKLFFILPLIVAISISFIHDMDSPRGGLIHVAPLNLISLSHSLQSP